MTRHLYIAYGSNLHFGQMSMRCPGAELVAIGYLKDYELIFKGRSGSCFCTIRKDNGMRVPIGIWAVSDANLYALDRYEGYPSHYRRIVIQPSQLSITHKKYQNMRPMSALVYVMNNGRLGAPSQQYYNTVQQGYIDCGLDLRCLEAALQRSIKK